MYSLAAFPSFTLFRRGFCFGARSYRRLGCNPDPVSTVNVNQYRANRENRVKTMELPVPLAIRLGPLRGVGYFCRRSTYSHCNVYLGTWQSTDASQHVRTCVEAFTLARSLRRGIPVACQLTADSRRHGILNSRANSRARGGNE